MKELAKGPIAAFSRWKVDNVEGVPEIARSQLGVFSKAWRIQERGHQSADMSCLVVLSTEILLRGTCRKTDVRKSVRPMNDINQSSPLHPTKREEFQSSELHVMSRSCNLYRESPDFKDSTRLANAASRWIRKESRRAYIKLQPNGMT